MIVVDTGPLVAALDVDDADHDRCLRLVRQYADLPLGAVDASVISVAERLNVAEIATLDLRHFTVVRAAHAESLTLLPQP